MKFNRYAVMNFPSLIISTILESLRDKEIQNTFSIKKNTEKQGG